MNKFIMISIVCLIVIGIIGSVIAVGEIAKYKDKEISLSASQTTALEQNKLYKYSIEDKVIKGLVTSRCIKNAEGMIIRCFSVNEVGEKSITDLDLIEDKIIKQIADNLVSKQSKIDIVEIAEGIRTIKGAKVPENSSISD